MNFNYEFTAYQKSNLKLFKKNFDLTDSLRLVKKV